MATTSGSDLNVMFFGTSNGGLDMRSFHWCNDNDWLWCQRSRESRVLCGEIQQRGKRHVIRSVDEFRIGRGVGEMVGETLKEVVMITVMISWNRRRKRVKKNDKEREICKKYCRLHFCWEGFCEWERAERHMLSQLIYIQLSLRICYFKFLTWIQLTY